MNENSNQLHRVRIFGCRPFTKEMNTVRDVILWVRQGANPEAVPLANPVDFLQTAGLLIEAGYIRGKDETVFKAIFPEDHRPDSQPLGRGLSGVLKIDGLTWQGHELADLMQHGALFAEILTFAKSNSLPFNLGLLPQLAKTYLDWRGKPPKDKAKKEGHQ